MKTNKANEAKEKGRLLFCVDLSGQANRAKHSAQSFNRGQSASGKRDPRRDRCARYREIRRRKEAFEE